jgi:6,7-dimethyl-8-ribityllumazine synthase
MSQEAPIFDFSSFDNRNLRVAVIASRFNESLVGGMLERTLAALLELGVQREHIRLDRVPGSAELPYACQVRAQEGLFDVLVALGVLIAGETQHHDIVSRTVSMGLQHVALQHNIPVINGVISAETWQQAEDRTIGRIERGREFAEAAVIMAHWK